MSKKSGKRIFIISVIVFDSLYIALTSHTFLSQREFSQNSVQVQGTITAVDVSGSRSSKLRYTPTVKFVTFSNTAVEFKDDAAKSFDPELYAVGQSIEVLYDKRDFAKAQLLSTFNGSKSGTTFFAILSALLVIISIFMFIADLPKVKSFSRRNISKIVDQIVRSQIPEEIKQEQESSEVIDPVVQAEIQNLLQQGRMIDAIKLYRKVMGAGLAKATEAINNMRKEKP
jgi:hypothetical protein